MVDVTSKKCRTEDCGNKTLFGVAGTKTGEYCEQHAPDGIVNVKDKKWRTEDCGKKPSFGVADTKTMVYCAQHASNGMVNVYSRICTEPKAAATFHRSELQVRKRRSTVHNTSDYNATSKEMLADTTPGRKPLVI